MIIKLKIPSAALSFCLAAGFAFAQDAAAPAQATQEASAGSAAAPAGGDVITTRLKIVRMIYSNKMIFTSTVGAGGTYGDSENTAPKMVTLWYQTGIGETAAWQKVDIRPGVTTKTLNYTGPQNLRFYRQIPPAAPEEPPTYKQVSDINLPPNTEDVYLLMSQMNDNISFYAMNVSPTELPKGRAVIMNMTSVPLLVSLGNEKPFILRKGAHVVCSPRVMHDGNYAELIMGYSENKAWVPAIRTSVAVSDEKKRYILVAHQYSKKLSDIRIETLVY